MCIASSAVAQGTYPDRPIRYIVPSAAGGGADISARLLTNELSQQLKQQFAGGNLPPPHTRSFSGHKLVQDNPVAAAGDD